jgi:hypothetical protein
MAASMIPAATIAANSRMIRATRRTSKSRSACFAESYVPL